MMRSFLAVATTLWGLLMSLAPLLQVRLVVRRRNSAGVSAVWIAVLLIGFALWGPGRRGDGMGGVCARSTGNVDGP